MILSKCAERLYLQKDDGQSIAVDLPIPLPQHQIDGIRFLFKLYKKKAPGAILNDPSGYGKCLQIVLFLTAIRPLLKKPVLILSNSVANWVEHFQIWTNCSDDLAVKVTNPFAKNQIFVNEIQDGAVFSRRALSVVVLHDEGSTGELLKMGFNADYRIWITAIDLKENLYSLASVYECLHPNQKFNVDLFTSRDRRDAVEKALLLDAVLEDFLVRRTDFLTPFHKSESLKPSISPVKVSRKNKDPTGTKVKRSKRMRILDDDEEYHNNVKDISASDHTINANNSDTKDVVVSYANDNSTIDVNCEKTSERDNVDVAKSMAVDFNEAVKEIEINENNHSIEQLQNGGTSVALQNTESNDTQEYMLETEEICNGDTKTRILVPATEESCESQSIFGVEANSEQADNNKRTEIDTSTRKNGVYIPETETENSETSDKLLNGKESTESQIVNWKYDDDIVIKNDKSEKKKSNLDEFDAELAAFEAKALKKIKGSILDSLF